MLEIVITEATFFSMWVFFHEHWAIPEKKTGV